MKLKIEIKNRFTGKVLFEFEKEGNTIKQTVLEALKVDADLSGANLSGANLIDANLIGANLSGANLRGANLRDANLIGANLSGANLRGANLRDANLIDADLRGADLIDADLSGANLSGANLIDADLRGADLIDADLRGADLRGYKVKTAAVFTGLYTYIVIPYITEQGEKRVKMGCHDRSVSEWDSDFWNNKNEFPNDGSKKSQMRLMAYETAKRWFDIVSN